MKEVILYESQLGDVSDPDDYACAMIAAWQDSEAGRWAKDHVKLRKIWYANNDVISEWAQRDKQPHIVTYTVKIIAEMNEEDYTYYTLKWNSKLENIS